MDVYSIGVYLGAVWEPLFMLFRFVLQLCQILSFYKPETLTSFFPLPHPARVTQTPAASISQYQLASTTHTSSKVARGPGGAAVSPHDINRLNARSTRTP